MRVGDRGEHPPGHRLAVVSQSAVHRADHHVQPGQQLGSWSSEPSARMSTSMPVSRRNPGGSAVVDGGDAVELLAQPVRGQPVGHRQPGRVVGQHQVLVAQLDRGQRHLLDRRAAVGPVRVAVAVAAQRLRSAAAAPSRSVPSSGDQAAQVDRLLAGQRLGDAAGGDLADPGQLGQRAGGGPRGQLSGGQRGERLGRRPERPDPVGGLVGPFQQEGDARRSATGSRAVTAGPPGRPSRRATASGSGTSRTRARYPEPGRQVTMSTRAGPPDVPEVPLVAGTERAGGDEPGQARSGQPDPLVRRLPRGDHPDHADGRDRHGDPPAQRPEHVQPARAHHEFVALDVDVHPGRHPHHRDDQPVTPATTTVPAITPTATLPCMPSNLPRPPRSLSQRRQVGARQPRSLSQRRQVGARQPRSLSQRRQVGARQPRSLSQRRQVGARQPRSLSQRRQVGARQPRSLSQRRQVGARQPRSLSQRRQVGARQPRGPSAGSVIACGRSTGSATRWRSSTRPRSPTSYGYSGCPQWRIWWTRCGGWRYAGRRPWASPGRWASRSPARQHASDPAGARRAVDAVRDRPADRGQPRPRASPGRRAAGRRAGRRARRGARGPRRGDRQLR